MSGPERIAICGLAGRFPGAPDLDTFWANLAAGRRGIRQFSTQELDAAGVDPGLRARPNHVAAAGVLADIDAFDAAFFGFTPREAELTDPQQRLFLECALEALEDAAVVPDPERLSIGVFASAGMDSYFRSCLATWPDLVETHGFEQLRIGNRIDNLATRTAYKLNLNGPSLTVQTGCSSSLVAVHLAARSVLAGECDVAIAGGVRISVGRHMGYVHVPGGVLSADGHCRAFDACAGGTVPGDGLGVVVLRRLSDALAEGNPVDAVILASAVNNDGAAKIGYTAPSVEGQASVIAEALALAGISHATVSHIETHGTATPLGDAIEIAALTAAFRAGTRDRGFCALTSVKSSIGHLDAAAGIAGLVRLVLEFRHGQIAPSVDFVAPNPRLGLEDSPFLVNERLRPWVDGAVPRRAGVSSFGIGGTNAHVLVEAPPLALPGPDSTRAEVLPLSAATSEALALYVERVGARLAAAGVAERAALGSTYRSGRALRPMRVALVASSQAVPRRFLGEGVPGPPPAVAFVFPGQGAQRPGMCAALWRDDPVFRDAFARVVSLHSAAGGADLGTLVFGAGAETAVLQQTIHAQPAIFAVSYALAQLFLSWGIRPDAMIGHSVGELVCACLAGVYALDDAVALVTRRATLMQARPPGAMLAVAMASAELAARLPAGIDLAAANGPRWSTAAGPAAAIHSLAARLDMDGVACRPLRTSHAFHSAMMAPADTEFGAFADRLRPGPVAIPWLSGVSGDWITEGELAGGGYWGRQMRGTVRFGDGIARLLDRPGRILLELGPGETLTRLVAPDCGRSRKQRAISADAAGPAPAAAALAELWTAGVTVDWEAYAAGRPRQRCHAPTHPMIRRRYWIDPPNHPSLNSHSAQPARPAPLGALAPLPFGDWFQVPVWTEAPRPGRPAGKREALVIAATDAGASRAQHLDIDAIGTGGVPPPSLLSSLARLRDRGGAAPRLVFLAGPGGTADLLRLAALARGLAETFAGAPAELTVITRGAFDVLGGEPVAPDLAMLAGYIRVMGQEILGLVARLVDLAADAAADPEALAELPAMPGDGALIALRRGRIWCRDLRPLRLPAVPLAQHLRPDAAYLIVGGLGGLGLTLAEAFAEAGAGHLVLTGRRAFPDRRDWARWQQDPWRQDSTRLRIERILAAEARGARLSIVTGDIADPAVAARAVAAARDGGRLGGLVHAAGVEGGGAMVLQDARAIARVLAPKVTGAARLSALLGAEPMDWVVLFSSLTALRGGQGQADYAAANAYLDALAEAGAFPAARQIVSVNWAAWAEVGMAATAAPGGETGAQRAARLSRAIPPVQGVEAFAAALASGMSRIVVSPYPLTLTSEPPAPAPAHRAHHPRPELSTDFVAPSQPVEARLVDIWGQIFGIEPIGVEDNFFELGGHSLMATQLVAAVRAAFGARLPLARLFEATTIAAQAELIEETLIDELERLDEPEALSGEILAQTGGSAASDA